MTGRNHRSTWVCSGVQPEEKKASGSLIAQVFRMVVPQRSELPKTRTEKVILPLGATMDEQRPACDLDSDGFAPDLLWFNHGTDLSAGGRATAFVQSLTDRGCGLPGQGGRGIAPSIGPRDFHCYCRVARPD